MHLNLRGAYSVMATLRHSLNKSFFFAGVFIILLYFFGRILTVCYHLNIPLTPKGGKWHGRDLCDKLPTG